MAEISERTAALNTQMRFGNYRKALVMAYSLRLDLQLAHPMTPKVHHELESVESVIENLERLKISKYQRWAKRFWDSIVESFQAPPAGESRADKVVAAEVAPEVAPPVAKPQASYLGESPDEIEADSSPELASGSKE